MKVDDQRKALKRKKQRLVRSARELDLKDENFRQHADSTKLVAFASWPSTCCDPSEGL